MITDDIKDYVNEAQLKALQTRKIHYIVCIGKDYAVTTLTPHCLQWRKQKMEWVKTIKPVEATV